jgi:hypothetical protein
MQVAWLVRPDLWPRRTGSSATAGRLRIAEIDILADPARLGELDLTVLDG